jgi:hypothetical protein
MTPTEPPSRHASLARSFVIVIVIDVIVIGIGDDRVTPRFFLPFVVLIPFSRRRKKKYGKKHRSTVRPFNFRTGKIGIKTRKDSSFFLSHIIHVETYLVRVLAPHCMVSLTFDDQLYHTSTSVDFWKKEQL